MPAFSGLYDGVFHEAYALITNPRPPLSGLARIVNNKRGMAGHVRANGGKAPATVKGVDADRNDMIVRGGWTYATRSDDAANRVTIKHIGGDVNTLENIALPATVADVTALKRTRDTRLNRAYARDEALTGATAPVLAERYQP